MDKFEDWKAPWEKDGSEFDAEKAKKLLYNLYGDKEALEAKVKTVTGERDTFKTKVDEFETKDLSEIDRLKRENEQLKSKPVEDTETKLENARLKLAIDNGLTVAQARRLIGTTPEELEADLPNLLEDLGPRKSDQKDPPKGTFKTGNDKLDDPFSMDEDLGSFDKRAALFD